GASPPISHSSTPLSLPQASSLPSEDTASALNAVSFISQERAAEPSDTCHSQTLPSWPAVKNVSSSWPAASSGGPPHEWAAREVISLPSSTFQMRRVPPSSSA